MKSKFLVLQIIILVLISGVAYAQGFTVTSVSTSDVITKKTDPASVYWLINIQLNGGGQSVIGTVDPATVKKFMNGQATTKQPFEISVETTDETATYNIANEGVPIYKLTDTITNAPETCAWYGCRYTAHAPSCPSNNLEIKLGESFWDYVVKRHCISVQQVGVKGAFENPTTGFNAKIKVRVGDIVKEKTICSGSTPGCQGSSVSFDDLGTATWTGSLVTGDSPPNQDNYIAVRKTSSNIWQIVRRSTFDAAYPTLSQIEPKVTELRTTWSGVTSTDDITRANTNIRNTIDDINRKADSIINEEWSFTSGQFSKDPQTGSLKVSLDRRLQSPNIVLRIRADWLGISIPSGQPKILSVNTGRVVSGEEGKVEIQVQNIGEAQGTFSAMLENCDPFVQSTTSQTSRKTLQPNNIDTISIAITGGKLSQDISKQCSVKIYDVNDPSISTYEVTTLALTTSKICIPGKVFSEGNSIKRCSNDGKTIEKVEDCKHGILSDGKGGLACSIDTTLRNYECTTDSQCGASAYCNQQVHACVQRSGCINLVNNGNSQDKADIAFVGDGYSDKQEFERDVRKLVDYDGNNGYNGLMSVEPFRSDKTKFNLWMITAGDKIGFYPNSEYINRSAAWNVASQCTSADYIAVISKKDFRSYAYLNSGDLYLSVGSSVDKYDGRTLLHEFGHSFGNLADEYVEPSLGNRPQYPNCAPDMETAQQWWAGMVGLTFSKGCSYIDGNIRPFFNTIMRNQYDLKVDFGHINQQALLEVLAKYR